ncbi:MAG: ion transporter [Pontiellaceae bacterium]|nr:ion transporter [Pontiellaceae bacterium]MBN2783933.1 ion transporter [Pontiellaceae bacterium]
MSEKSLKERIYIVIFEADTPAGKLFDVLLFGAILISVTLTMLQSVQPIRTEYGGLISGLNAGFTALFTVEYALRLWCARGTLRYARSFFGVVDLLAVLPFYLSRIFPATGFLDVVKVLRMLRIFRVLKMAQYVGEEDLLLKSLINSRRKIGIFLVAVMSIVVIVGSLMYVIEGEAHGFTSIPRSVYWAIVTITTVGYGDISPQTPIGQALAAFLMILAYSIIAVPTGIITAELGMETARRRVHRTCAGCGLNQHDEEALFCKRCGSRL